jgi:hypothetical protein
LDDDEGRHEESEAKEEILGARVAALLQAGGLRDEPLDAPRLPQRLVVAPEQRREQSLGFGRLGVDRHDLQVRPRGEVADLAVDACGGARAGSRELIGKFATALDDDDRHPPLDRMLDLVDGDFAAAGQNRDGELGTGDRVEDLKHERRLVAPAVAAGKHERRVIRLELRVAGRPVRRSAGERDLACRGHADEWRGGVAGCGRAAKRRDHPGFGRAVEDRRLSAGRCPQEPTLEEPDQVGLDVLIERLRPADDQHDRAGRANAQRGDEIGGRPMAALQHDRRTGATFRGRVDVGLQPHRSRWVAAAEQPLNPSSDGHRHEPTATASRERRGTSTRATQGRPLADYDQDHGSGGQ